MSRLLRWYDLITINIYFTGLTAVSQTMTPLVLPLLIQEFVGSERQGAYYGITRLWSLMAALVVQSLMGMLSDHSQLPCGRRRPFILVGTLASLVVITAIGFTAGLHGISGFWTLFLLMILLQVSLNTAQGAAQGLIPDLVPEVLRGRYSGVKAILEVPVPVILVSFSIGRLVAAGYLWAALGITMGILVLTMGISMFAPERRPQKPVDTLDWRPFLRLVGMSALFTGIILGMGRLIPLATSFLATKSLEVSLTVMGVIGFITMGVIIALGVWVSVQFGLGREARNSADFTWWIINRLAFLAATTNIAGFALFYLQGKLGLVRQEAAGPASRLIMFVGIFILVLGFPGGWLADRLGRKPLVGASGLIAALGALVLVFSTDFKWISLGAILVGAATGLFYTTNWALGTDIVPKAEAGRYLGISNLAGAGAGAVGAYIGGPIADYFSTNFPGTPGVGYYLLYAIYGLLFIFSILALRQIKSGYKSRPDKNTK